MGKKNLLHAMKLDEISLVDKGANAGAQVMIFKRDDSDDQQQLAKAGDWGAIQKYCGEVAQSCPPTLQPVVAATFAELQDKQEVQRRAGEFYSMVMTFQQSLNTILDDKDIEEGERKDLVEQSVREFHEAVMTELVEDSGADEDEGAEDEEDYSKRGNEDMTIEELGKRLEQIEAEAKELKATNAMLAKRADDAEKALKDANAKLAKAEDGAECELDGGGKGVMKEGKCVAKVDKAALPVAVQKQLETQEEAIKKLSADNAASNETIAKMKEDGEVKEAIAKAAKDYSKMPVKAEELGPVLRKVQKALSADEYGILEKAMKAGEAALELSMKSTGGDNSNDSMGGSAYKQVEAKAKELQKSDGKLTFEKAFAKVLAQDHDLAQKLRIEEAAPAVH